MDPYKIRIHKKPVNNYAYKIVVLGRESRNHTLEIGDSPKVDKIYPTHGASPLIVNIEGSGFLNVRTFDVYLNMEGRLIPADIYSITERIVQIVVQSEVCWAGNGVAELKIRANGALIGSFDFTVENCN